MSRHRSHCCCSCSCCSSSLSAASSACCSGPGAVTPAESPCPTDRYKSENKDNSPYYSVKMKCDFNCNHVDSGPILKPDISKMESGTPEYLEDFCKDCIKDHRRLSYSGPQNVSPTIVELKTENGPVHNKENQALHKLDASSEFEELESSRLYEDSGYSSFSQQSSPGEQQYNSILLSRNFIVSPRPCFLQSQSTEKFPNKNLLPILHFEEVVCSTLKKNAKRNPKVDWETVERLVSHGDFGLHNVIGRKMGLEQLDILSELFQRGLKHVLASVLRHLREMDLINVARVSATWKKILKDNKGAFHLYNMAMKKANENTTKFSAHAATREYVLVRAALASVQKSTAQAPSASKKVSRSKLSDQGVSVYSRHTEFSEVAKTLKKSESLRACIHCNSPAKFDPYLQRATCNRESCGFDFCTRCLCSYHITKDCSNEKPLKANSKVGPLPGSKKSKKNLRRL
ncbi:F-box only protein 5 [Monodelphis domestica]|uniref:F-box protein 5 n=1 Tax=Monodelphis domestica TaxID=13616 RepID=F7FTQ2_MONDO|nr:F-box only protein 5 [Monodelphis domestica]